jgi:hypothetical protein
MMRRVLTILLAVAALRPAAAVNVLYRESFDNGTGGWTNANPNGPAPTFSNLIAHQGSALECWYDLPDAAHPFILAKPEPPSLAGARSLRFWLRTSQPAIIVVHLSKANGAGYETAVFTAAATWQHVELSLDRFRLSQDSDDPDGHLDPAQIVHIALIDASRVIPLPTNDVVHRGLWLDEFQVDDQDCLTAYSTKGQLPFILENFQEDALSWTVGWGRLEHDLKAGEIVWHCPKDKPATGFPGLLGLLGQLPSKGPRSLIVTLQCSQTRKLAFLLQQQKRHNQPELNYHLIKDVTASERPTSFVLSLSDFAQNDNDPVQPLDLSKVSLFIVLDIDAAQGKADADNDLRLSELVLTSK